MLNISNSFCFVLYLFQASNKSSLETIGFLFSSNIDLNFNHLALHSREQQTLFLS